MKTRTGFVSNSSSSSFIAYGATTRDYPQALALIEKIAPGELLKHFELPIEEILEAVANYDLEWYEIEEKIDLPFDILNCCEEDTIIFGLVHADMDEDYGINRLGDYFGQAKIDEVTTVLETIGEKPEFLFGRYSC